MMCVLQSCRLKVSGVSATSSKRCVRTTSPPSTTGLPSTTLSTISGWPSLSTAGRRPFQSRAFASTSLTTSSSSLTVMERISVFATVPARLLGMFACALGTMLGAMAVGGSAVAGSCASFHAHE